MNSFLLKGLNNGLMRASMAKTTLSALSGRQILPNEFRLAHGGENKLSDTHFRGYDKRLFSMIDQDHSDHSSVIRINRTWRV